MRRNHCRQWHYIFLILSNHAKHRKPARLGKGANDRVITLAASRNNGTPVCPLTGGSKSDLLPIETETNEARDLCGQVAAANSKARRIFVTLSGGKVTAPQPNSGDLSVCGPIKLFLPAYLTGDPPHCQR